MIPGQSLVLYSRLHLITQNERLLRFILCLIVFDSITLQPTSIILGLTAVLGHDGASLHGCSIFEKIQMLIFTTQELIISSTYLWETRKLFSVTLPCRTKNILWEVVAINVLIICLDIALVTTKYCNLYMVRKFGIYIALSSLFYPIILYLIR
jgi:hypothetical protein